MAWGFGWKPYVSAAKRREQAGRKMHKLRKQGLAIQPVEIEGRKIARTFWGQSWCNHLESFSDYENRLPRGRTYVRNGSVCHLEIASAEVTAIVSGSSLYDVRIVIKKLPENKWAAVKERCSGKIGSLLELLQGRLSDSVMAVVTDRREGLFPLPAEISMECSCPDWAVMCKHIAAVLYGVGARLDYKPELLFLLRGVDHEELIFADAVAATFVTGGKGGSTRRRIADSDLEDVFGIEMLEEGASEVGRQKRNLKKEPPETQASTRSSKAARNGNTNGATVQRPHAAKPASGETLTGKTVRELRTRLDMSQAQLARLLGVSAVSISNWENQGGRLNLQPRTATALAGAIGLTNKQAWKQLDKA